MGRSRQLKPGFFKNEYLVSLPMATRLLFAGLWTLADKEGRLEDRPLRIKMDIFPADDVDVDKALTELASTPEPFIVRYESQGVRLIQVVKWHENQKPHHQEKDSILPSPEVVRTKARITSDKQAKRGVKVTSNKDKVLGEGECEGEPTTEQPTAKPFDQFWEVVHAKDGKREAEKAYGHAVNRLVVEKPGVDPHDFLRDRMAEFAKSPRANPTTHTPMRPSTWLNAAHYDDDPAVWNRGSPPSGKPSPEPFDAAKIMGLAK